MLRRADWHLTYRWARRIAISIVGGTVLVIGIAMLVLPGPGLIVIPVGLAILGAEYAWARRWLRKVKVRTAYYVDKIKGNGKKPAPAETESVAASVETIPAEPQSSLERGPKSPPRDIT